MAFIKCPECGKEISDKAKACPNCGYAMSSKRIKNKIVEGMYIVGAIGLVCGFIFLIYMMIKPTDYANYGDDVKFYAKQIVTTIDDYLDGNLSNNDASNKMDDAIESLNKIDDFGASPLALEASTLRLKFGLNTVSITELKDIRKQIAKTYGVKK